MKEATLPVSSSSNGESADSNGINESAAVLPETNQAQQKENTQNQTKANTTTKVKGNAIFLMPVQGPIGSGFGERIHPIKKTKEFHKGLDIEANMGTIIEAAADGLVIEAGSEKTYGNYIKIKHSDGLETLYAHCLSLLVKKGKQVKKGDQIAKVGNTGSSQGPHLHFEVRKSGTAIDPLPLTDLKK